MKSDGQTLGVRLDRIEETLGHITDTTETGGQTLLRGRVKRLEEAVGEIHHAQASIEQSLRSLSLASLTIKRALSDVIGDLAALSQP